jgi:hypothetical protein
MDHKSIELSPEDRQQFNEIFEVISLTQTELATRAKVSQSWLSQSVFTGYRPNTNREMLERVVIVMTELLKTRPPDSRFSEERTASAIAFLGRFTVAASAVVVNPSKIYPPGGIVPLDATYYVERNYADGQIDEALRPPTPSFIMMVRGPVQCGKSSLLARLEQKALEKGIKTAWFDPGTISKNPEEKQADISANLSAKAAAALSELLQNRWRLTPPRSEIVSPANFINWLISALTLAASEPRLLILDNLVRLGAYGVDEWLSSFVRDMANRRAKGRGAQISIAVGLTYHLGRDFSRTILEQSSIVHWWPHIELDWFNFNEVVELDEAIRADGALFSEDSFKDAVSLIRRLREGEELLSGYLRERIAPDLLDQAAHSGKPNQHLISTLADELNNILKSGPLYDEERFKGIKLTEQTQALIKDTLQGKALIRLNRILLEEVYPDEILKTENLFDLFGGQPYLTHAAAADDEFLGSVRRWNKNESESDGEFLQSHVAYRNHRNAIRFAIIGPGWDINDQTRDVIDAFANLDSGGEIESYNNEVFLGASKLIKEAYAFEQLKKTGLPLPEESYSPKRHNFKLGIYRLMARDFKEALGGDGHA